ncbi:GNAT family N-acetyltransferase [Bradyrhizobium uaiense]|uniref:GNAT family N-acetyltransferase n=1 Tax=Bradyrhizobium uaiense TaxID=2594946 RepID=A0A6P1BHC3_9BRAD|nr:GNAT family N-acetyltransferase [Bradyrhizobium uaiense]NEU97011.1 GNAT family N-acetyltransferase [Bradyrhizobium uaiense]
MIIEFTAILDGYVGHDLEVSQRILASSKGRRTQQFIARRNGAEIGFVSFDELPEMNCPALCELFVVTRLRGSGLGKLLLEAVEARARGRLRMGHPLSMAARIGLSGRSACDMVQEARLYRTNWLPD